MLEVYGGKTHTLARSGPINWEVGKSLPGPTGVEIARRSRRGPWSWDNAGAQGGHQRITSAFGPIVRNRALVGVLVLTSDPSDPTSADAIPVGQTLATAIELAPAVAELLAVRNAAGIDLVASRADLVDIVENERFHPVFQPIVRIASGAIVGFEALTRFDDNRPPAKWFVDSVAVDNGLDLDLEIATLHGAFAVAGDLPRDAFLSVNASARLILERDRLRSVLDEAPERAIVLELTERESVDDYEGLKESLRAFPGVHLAVDDAGAGYSSLRHILALEPHFIKLDQTWVSGLDEDVARQVLVAGLAQFAAVTGGELIAEGIESEAERRAVAAAGATLGQGFLFGKPSPIEAWT